MHLSFPPSLGGRSSARGSTAGRRAGWQDRWRPPATWPLCASSASNTLPAWTCWPPCSAGWAEHAGCEGTGLLARVALWGLIAVGAVRDRLWP